MNSNNIKPEKITKPIQLLSVWLIGLIILVSSLITGASIIKSPSWLPVFFSISAVSIIPLFLILIFLLQTKFRPQMQEDEFYSQYLNKETQSNDKPNEQIIENISSRLDSKIIELTEITKNQLIEINERINQVVEKAGITEVISDNNESPEKIFEEFQHEQKAFIFLNINLKSVDKIVKYLSNKKININQTFGQGNTKPEVFLLSFGPEADLKTLKTLINDLPAYGLQFLRSVNEDFQKDRIYIGSYAYREGKNITAITLEILDSINQASSTLEIYSLILNENNKNL